jgi:hypothetical protein
MDIRSFCASTKISEGSAVAFSGAPPLVFRGGFSFVAQGAADAAGDFLVDSEAQLQAAAGAFVPPPPGAGQAAAMNAPAAAQANAELSTQPSPPHKGSNTVRVKLTDQSGKPVARARVTVTFFMAAMPAMGMAAMKTAHPHQRQRRRQVRRSRQLGFGRQLAGHHYRRSKWAFGDDSGDAPFAFKGAVFSYRVSRLHRQTRGDVTRARRLRCGPVFPADQTSCCTRRLARHLVGMAMGTKM